MKSRKKSINRKRFRIKKKKPLYQKRFFWLFLLGFLTAAGLFYLIVFADFFQIKEIYISGNQRVATEEIEELVEKQISKRILFSRNQSIFLFRGRSIAENLLEEFIEIDNVDLKRELPDKLIVKIRERVAVADFCNKEGECFLVDKKGIAFEQDGAEIGLLIVDTGQEIFLKQQLIGAEELGNLFLINQVLNEKLDLSADYFWLDKMRLNVRVDDGWEIYFNLKNDISDQLFNLETVLKQEIAPEKQSALEYIDLRFGSRVYYK